MDNQIRIRKLPPAWFIKGINSFRTGLLNLNRRMFPAGVVLYEYFQYFWLLPCLRVAAELDIAGKLDKKPLKIEELASLTKTDPDYLYRMLRALASQKIFREVSDKTFSNTRLSKALIDGPDSLRYMLIQHLGSLNWSACSEFPYTVRHGRDAFMKQHGKPVYEYLKDHPAEAELFEKSMTNLTQLAIEPVINAYDFSGTETLADIGGGQGLLLASILYKYPEMKGILFDLPAGLIKAAELLERFKVSSRTDIVPGDFFSSIPIADTYLLKHVVHNWSDHDAVRILQKIKESMPLTGKVLLVEMVIEEGNSSSFGKLIDIQMMISMQEGKERTRLEYESILRQADLKITRIIPTIAPFSIIEAVPET